MQMVGYLICAFVSFITLILVWRWRERRRTHRRRSSLRSLPDGRWVWTEPDGTEMVSNIHPDRPGGAWFKPGLLNGRTPFIDRQDLGGRGGPEC